jgi:hypothetical protein
LGSVRGGTGLFQKITRKVQATSFPSRRKDQIFIGKRANPLNNNKTGERDIWEEGEGVLLAVEVDEGELLQDQGRI